MSDRSKAALERAKRLIRGLQEKTEDRGATEGEAMEAARKLGELLEQYGLTIDEVGVREDAAQCAENELYAADEFAGSLVVGISKFCTLISYQNKHSGHGTKYVIFGTPHDLEIAKYLFEVCAEAMEHDWAGYMEAHGYSMKKRASFRLGFSSRVYSRLMEMKAERDARAQSQSRALVVLKDQLVKSEWDKKDVKLQRGRKMSAADPHAAAHGRVAGDRVNLNSPLGGGRSETRLSSG